ncbi:SDR family NAD(P)-dependent oxidoreductase [Desulfopila sp. IMCC35008]|uniref:SDR family NAD(P)-dependent oxidoreductase n=1 Tax=Desulfopila sp. IMCC35008 TaxID=2653858 RepID=UPI0013D29492|nr:SDR family NAD(P)-dependent oxidoreductase [Desulfopila sp. IMCC35008]
MNILITGATSGIGQQLALDYQAQGQQVWAVGRNPEALQELQIKGLHTGQLDLTQREQSLEWFATLPQLDLAILNAGNCEYINLPEFDSSSVQRVMRANVESLAISIEGVLPPLRNSENRQLAIVGSSAAYLPLPRAEAYGASKAAVAYLAKTLRIDLMKEGIDVSLICPGFVKTPLTDLNDFDMPFRITAEEASKAIQDGIRKRKAEIHFPKKFTLMLKLFSWLPDPLWTRLAQKMVR